MSKEMLILPEYPGNLIILGTQGSCEYAQDRKGTLWYRLTDRPRDSADSWHVVTA